MLASLLCGGTTRGLWRAGTEEQPSPGPAGKAAGPVHPTVVPEGAGRAGSLSRGSRHHPVGGCPAVPAPCGCTAWEARPQPSRRGAPAREGGRARESGEDPRPGAAAGACSRPPSLSRVLPAAAPRLRRLIGPLRRWGSEALQGASSWVRKPRHVAKLEAKPQLSGCVSSAPVDTIAYIFGRKWVRCPCNLYPSREAGRDGTPLHPSAAPSTWGRCRHSLPGQHAEPVGCSGGRRSRPSEPDPQTAVLSVAGDSLFGMSQCEKVTRCHAVHRVPPALAPGPPGGGGGQRAGRVDVCAGRGAAEDTFGCSRARLFLDTLSPNSAV